MLVNIEKLPHLRSEPGEKRGHWSFSQFNMFTRCNFYHRLKYREGVPEETNWALVGGSAFHKYTETIDAGEAVQWPVFLDDYLQRANLNPHAIKAMNRGKEGYEFWLNLGEEMASTYCSVMHREYANHIGDGPPFPGLSVELKVDVPFQSTSIVGYVDRLWTAVTSVGQLTTILDIKTGRTKNVDRRQYALYIALLLNLDTEAIEAGASSFHCAQYNARSGDLEYFSVSVACILDTIEQMRRAITIDALNLHVPNISYNCKYCPVAAHCELH